MTETYLDRLEAEGASLPETVVDVIRTKIYMLEEILADIDYLESEGLNTSTRSKQVDAWSETRQTIKDLTANERELNSLLTKMFDHAYHNAMDHLYDR